MSHPSVAVVILSWNGKKFLEQFLPSLLKTTYANTSFYVADNASTDDSVEFLKKNFPSVNLIQIEKNFGFAEGYNVALKRVGADYYVLLNQDVEVTSSWIEPLVTLMERDKTIAACQPKLHAFHDKLSFEYAGAAGGFLDKHGYAFCRGRFFDTIEKDNGQYDSPMEIAWASGACLFIRSHIYHQLGGLDADFFAHFEEIDLCWRIKNAGYSIRYCPDSIVYHVGGGSLQHGNPKKTFLNYRNNLAAMVKNLPDDVVLTRTSTRFVLDILSAYKNLFTGNWRDYFAIMKAHIHFASDLPQILSKRKAVWKTIVQHKIGVPNQNGFYKGSIIADYFIRRIRFFSELATNKFN